MQAASWPPCICLSSSPSAQPSPELSQSRLPPVPMLALCWRSDPAPIRNFPNLCWQRSCRLLTTDPPQSSSPELPCAVGAAYSVKELSQVIKGKRGDRRNCGPCFPARRISVTAYCRLSTRQRGCINWDWGCVYGYACVWEAPRRYHWPPPAVNFLTNLTQDSVSQSALRELPKAIRLVPGSRDRCPQPAWAQTGCGSSEAFS